MTALVVLKALWGFLRSPLGQVLAVAVAGLMVLSLADARGYRRGVEAERGRWDAKIKADAAKARAKEAKDAKAADKSAERVEAVRVETRWRTQTIIKEIPYALPSDPAVPGLRWGFVRLHDEATVGVSGSSDRAGEPDGAVSPVTDADAIQVIAENYGACRFDQARLAELQSLLKEWGMAR